MDRLSDRIGSLIPGGSRLPPRHPIKVSLVMGLLGLLSSWADVGLKSLTKLADSHFQISSDESLPTAVGVGMIIVMPLAIWLGQKWSRVLCSVAVGSVLTAIAMHLAGMHRFRMILKYPFHSPPVELRHTILIYCGLGFLMGILIAGSARPKKHLPSAVLCGIVLAAAMFAQTAARYWRADHLRKFLPLNRYASWMIVAAFNAFDQSLLHVSLALALGAALWDATPLPKFERESTDGT